MRRALALVEVHGLSTSAQEPSPGPQADEGVVRWSPPDLRHEVHGDDGEGIRRVLEVRTRNPREHVVVPKEQRATGEQDEDDRRCERRDTVVPGCSRIHARTGRYR